MPYKITCWYHNIAPDDRSSSNISDGTIFLHLRDAERYANRVATHGGHVHRIVTLDCGGYWLSLEECDAVHTADEIRLIGQRPPTTERRTYTITVESIAGRECFVARDSDGHWYGHQGLDQCKTLGMVVGRMFVVVASVAVDDGTATVEVGHDHHPKPETERKCKCKCQNEHSPRPPLC